MLVKFTDLNGRPVCVEASVITCIERNYDDSYTKLECHSKWEQRVKDDVEMCAKAINRAIQLDPRRSLLSGDTSQTTNMTVTKEDSDFIPGLVIGAILGVAIS